MNSWSPTDLFSNFKYLKNFIEKKNTSQVIYTFDVTLTRKMNHLTIFTLLTLAPKITKTKN